MRIIGGTVRGRRLVLPRKVPVRPTLDRVRESLFDVLGDEPAGKRVLDLFAGTGALALEALSRGAEAAVLVDEHPACVDAIRANLRHCGLEDRATVIRARLPSDLARVRSATTDRFHLVFLDPPYGEPGKRRILQGLHQFAMLGEHATIVIEHGRRDPLDPVPEPFARVDERRYGHTMITFLTYHPGEGRDDG